MWRGEGTETVFPVHQTGLGSLQEVGGGGLVSVNLKLAIIRRPGGGVVHRGRGGVFFLQIHRARFIHLSLCSLRTPPLVWNSIIYEVNNRGYPDLNTFSGFFFSRLLRHDFENGSKSQNTTHN